MHEELFKSIEPPQPRTRVVKFAGGSAQDAREIRLRHKNRARLGLYQPPTKPEENDRDE